MRRLTGRPSSSQITDDEIIEYVNAFYQFDFPENLRLFSNIGTFSFITEANVDKYNIISSDPSSPKFNEIVVSFDGSQESAADIYYNLSPPIYINGRKGFYFQSREEFIKNYPSIGSTDSQLKGDGIKNTYELKFPKSPILAGSVTIGVIDNTGTMIKVVDEPTNRSTGNWLISNSQDQLPGSINYLTGEADVTFPNVIPIGNEITFTFVPYKPNVPQAILFYDNVLTIRPVPDKPYPVEFNAFLTPKALLKSLDNPTMKQWWQYIAYGTAKKIFEDSQDQEGINQIMPAFKEQETLVLYRHIVQQTHERVATIYSPTTDGGFFGLPR
ncbi:MAG: hypothetical protein E3J43_08580 [Candidatus Heimdallarchaeota archaeon]|nr:MAG: hypothetical protein E3J43_08580 [Candidatus Heimdallarchaeota archaeon]